MTPENRIKKLKELEEKRKRDIEKAEIMILDAQADIRKEKEKIDEIEVPGIETDITHLWEKSDSELENTVSEAAPEELPPPGINYQIPGAVQQEIRNIYSQLTELGYNNNWSENDFQDFYDVSERLDTIRNNFEEKIKKGYTISDEVTMALVASQSVDYNIRKYREFGK